MEKLSKSKVLRVVSDFCFGNSYERGLSFSLNVCSDIAMLIESEKFTVNNFNKIIFKDMKFFKINKIKDKKNFSKCLWEELKNELGHLT